MIEGAFILHMLPSGVLLSLDGIPDDQLRYVPDLCIFKSSFCIENCVGISILCRGLYKCVSSLFFNFSHNILRSIFKFGCSRGILRIVTMIIGSGHRFPTMKSDICRMKIWNLLTAYCEQVRCGVDVMIVSSWCRNPSHV
jgi:hypothetical protein